MRHLANACFALLLDVRVLKNLFSRASRKKKNAQAQSKIYAIAYVLKGKSNGTDIAVRESTSSLREITCRIGSHSVTCLPPAVTFPPSPHLKLVLD